MIYQLYNDRKFALPGSYRLPGFHLGKPLVQDVTTFTGTMLEVKKTHVLVVLDLQQNADLKHFMQGAAGHCHAFRACMH